MFQSWKRIAFETIWTGLRRMKWMSFGQGRLGNNLGAVAAGLKQPQNHHDLCSLELLWSRVGHSSSVPT
ncbi:hypothetical protein ACFX13_007379 [Malus domestica]